MGGVRETEKKRPPPREQETTVICKLCQRKVVADEGNTSNLKHHLSRKHLRIQRLLKLKAVSFTSKPGKSLADTFARGTPYSKTSKRWVEITNAITFHVAKDKVPLSTVKIEGFGAIIKTLPLSTSHVIQ
ncbi:hypothetical protein ILYODFUR_016046 [Ilyodon furcidens]|uniref:BED-type domain-containing protein n=1 Tax=Ilyodon furcidens TaxID=33524 RepID=A0ABV0SYJ8_9TELE